MHTNIHNKNTYMHAHIHIRIYIINTYMHVHPYTYMYIHTQIIRMYIRTSM